MPKSKAQKYYAVSIGRNGPKVYNTWDECKDKVSRYPGAVHKSFKSKSEAEKWLDSQPKLRSILPELSTPTVVDAKSSGSAPVSTTKEGAGDSLPRDKATVSLSPEQRKVFTSVKAGNSVFFTGSAGTGKSVLLREIIDLFGGRDSVGVAITATTGIAAVHIGGCTLHSWAGIGIGHETAKQFVGKCCSNERFSAIAQRWRNVKVLIIDEISMLDGKLFDKLEAIGRGFRRSEKPFGGIQLVLCGDFCQLPPINGTDAKGREVPAVFAFDATQWKNCIRSPMMLTKVFRQKDQNFVEMLNEMRFGKILEDTIQAFMRLSRKVEYADGIEPTEIYPTRSEVWKANKSRLDQLPGKSQIFIAHDRAGVDSEGKQVSEKRRDQLLEKLLCQQAVNLKVGAQVMLIKNLVQGQLVNGSVGKVIKFSTAQEMSQDRTGAKTDETSGPRQEAPQNPEIPARLWPVVRFTNGTEKIIEPVHFDVTNAEGKMEALRIQIPLILAWALSVHKSQGQTLERVKVDLRRTFEKGQAYVALSRATSMEHLQIVNFNPRKVMTHPRVLAWYGVPQDEGFGDDMECEDVMRSYHDY